MSHLEGSKTLTESDIRRLNPNQVRAMRIAAAEEEVFVQLFSMSMNGFQIGEATIRGMRIQLVSLRRLPPEDHYVHAVLDVKRGFVGISPFVQREMQRDSFLGLPDIYNKSGISRNINEAITETGELDRLRKVKILDEYIQDGFTANNIRKLLRAVIAATDILIDVDKARALMDDELDIINTAREQDKYRQDETNGIPKLLRTMVAEKRFRGMIAAQSKTPLTDRLDIK